MLTDFAIVWTPERKAELLRLAKPDDRSALEIAAAMGMRYSQVERQLWGMGIKLTRKPSRAEIRAAEMRPVAAEPVRQEQAALANSLSRLDLWQPHAASRPVNIHGLTKLHCNSVLDMRIGGLPAYCGAPREPGCTYCAPHAKAFFNPNGGQARWRNQ